MSKTGMSPDTAKRPGKRVLTPEQEAALERLTTQGWPPGNEKITREDIYNERLDELDARRARHAEKQPK
jgi:hypothetical protein